MSEPGSGFRSELALAGASRVTLLRASVQSLGDQLANCGASGLDALTLAPGIYPRQFGRIDHHIEAHLLVFHAAKPTQVSLDVEAPKTYTSFREIGASEMTYHSTPNGNMNASQLVALFEEADRHPNALGYELRRCKTPVLVTLAYQQHAPQPLNSDVPDELASLAYDEMERRQNATARLLSDNPSLRAALGK